MCIVYSYIHVAATAHGHLATHIHQSTKPGISPKTQEGDDERVPTTSLQVGLPGLYIENGRVDVVLVAFNQPRDSRSVS